MLILLGVIGYMLHNRQGDVRQPEADQPVARMPDPKSRPGEPVAPATRTPLEVAPLPREVDTRGTLILKHTIPIVKDADVWVEIDGQRVADWLAGTKEVRILVEPGPRRVCVISIYRGVRQIVFDEQVTIPRDRNKEVLVDPRKKK